MKNQPKRSPIIISLKWYFTSFLSTRKWKRFEKDMNHERFIRDKQTNPSIWVTPIRLGEKTRRWTVGPGAGLARGDSEAGQVGDHDF